MLLALVTLCAYAQIRPSTGTPDMKESISLGFHTQDKYPTDAVCPGFSTTAKQFMAACQSLSMKLLSCFAVGLGFPDNFFEQVLSSLPHPSFSGSLVSTPASYMHNLRPLCCMQCKQCQHCCNHAMSCMMCFTSYAHRHGRPVINVDQGYWKNRMHACQQYWDVRLS